MDAKRPPEIAPVEDESKTSVKKTPHQKLGDPMSGSYLKKTIDMKWKIRT